MNRAPIAILGAGNVGMALAGALVAAGESVIFGVPDPAKYRAADNFTPGDKPADPVLEPPRRIGACRIDEAHHHDHSGRPGKRKPAFRRADDKEGLTEPGQGEDGHFPG
jgi:2-polyprenyl-6-methoxyphenol hydroxylase-like FAD-dependent oxidoreductase